MDLPKKKKGAPKLPPKGPGGGAGARQRQFDLERGLDGRSEGDARAPGPSGEGRPSKPGKRKKPAVSGSARSGAASDSTDRCEADPARPI